MSKLEVKQGDRLVFKGYESLEEGMEPLFEEGDILIAKKVEATDQKGVLKVSAYAEVEGKDGDIDTLYYPGEVELAQEAKATKATKPAKVAKAAPAPVKEVDEDTDEDEVDEESEDETEDEVLDEDEEDDADEESVDAEEDEEEEEEAPAPRKSKAVAKVDKPKKVAKVEKPAKTAKASPARTKDEENNEVIHHFKSVQKIIKKSDDMLDAAKNLAVQAEKTYFNLGGVLAEIYRTKAYGEAGYLGEGAWDDYLQKELNLEYRKAMYLIEIYKAFSKLDVDEDRLADIGWTKIRMLAPYIKGLSQEEVDELLGEVATMSRDEISEHIKSSLVSSSKGGDKIKKIKFSGFSAFADEGEYIGAAIERAQELVENADYQSAIKYIIRDWAVTTDGVTISLQDAIAMIEGRFGVKLAVVNDSAEPEVVKPAPKKVKVAEKVAVAPKQEKTKKVAAKR